MSSERDTMASSASHPDPRPFFEDGERRLQDFRLAKEYFARHPRAIKIRREDWDTILKEMYPKGAPSPTPTNSYLRHTDNTVVAIGHGEKALLGTGGFGRVKLAMDINGGIYALKIEEKSMDSKETQMLKNIGLLHGDKIRRQKTGKDKKGTKYYTQMTYLGVSIFDRMRNRRMPLSFDEKLKISRKSAWELHKLHVGQLTNGQKLVHRDIKPENIMINKKGGISLTDFGMTEELTDKDWNVTDKGTPMFLPGFKERLKPDAILAEMSRLGAVGTDTLALKRTISYKNKNLLSPHEFESLPDDIKIMIKNEDSSDYLFSSATPLDIAYAFLSFEMEKTHRLSLPKNPTSEQKEMICQCFALLDNVNEYQDLADDTLGHNEINTYQQQLLAVDANYPEILGELKQVDKHVEELCIISKRIKKISSDFNLIEVDDRLQTKIREYQEGIRTLPIKEAGERLTLMNECLGLVEEMSREAIDGKKDTEMQRYLKTMIDNLLAPGITTEHFNTHKAQLTKDLACARSQEMLDVKHQIKRLETAHFKWHAAQAKRLTLKRPCVMCLLEKESMCLLMEI